MDIMPAVTIALFTFAITQAAEAQSRVDCGSLDNAYGPFDYTNSRHFNEKLPVVEAHHFDAGVEQLLGHYNKPGSAAMLGKDIDYTLRAFPNHHRALITMVRYYLEKVPAGSGTLQFSAECYFDRAIRLASDDATVHMIHGYYKYKKGDIEAALESYKVALQIAPNSAEVHYNTGLMYTELRQYNLAGEHAVIAYDLGYPLPGLKNKLLRAGAWPSDK